MDLLHFAILGTPLWMWLAFLMLVAALLALDLGVIHRKQREIGVGESLSLSAVYIALGLGFGGGLWLWMGQGPALAYLTGFVVEKSLAMDNVFVIAMIFSFFAIPREHQHRVLFWGVLGVIVLRAIMIALGSTLIEHAEWVLYLFAAFLVATGVKMWLTADQAHDIGDSAALRFLRKRLRITDGLEGSRFFVRRPSLSAGGRSGSRPRCS